MSYSNEFLRNFRPIFFSILKEKQIPPAQVEVEIIDEDVGGESIFEPAGVREVLQQLAEDLNFLTIYTERPAYFYEFAETMYEENGLIVRLFSKAKLGGVMRGRGQERGDMAALSGALQSRSVIARQVVFDFEWEGSCYFGQMRPGRYYIPIYKKPWKPGNNLDIIVPIGYNTVIVKGEPERRKQPGRDRFEEAFYNL